MMVQYMMVIQLDIVHTQVSLTRMTVKLPDMHEKNLSATVKVVVVIVVNQYEQDVQFQATQTIVLIVTTQITRSVRGHIKPKMTLFTINVVHFKAMSGGVELVVVIQVMRIMVHNLQIHVLTQMMLRVVIMHRELHQRMGRGLILD